MYKIYSQVRRTALSTVCASLILGSSALASAQEAAAPIAPPPAAPAEAAPAVAQMDSAPQLKAVSAWLVLGYSGAYGLGVSYMMPVGPRLLRIPGIADQLAIEFDLNYTRESYGYGFGYSWTWNEILPVAGCMWQFWLKPNLAVYPKVDFGYRLGWESGYDCHGISGCSSPTNAGVYVDGSVGVIYTIGKLALRGQVGYPLVKAGVAFAF